MNNLLWFCEEAPQKTNLFLNETLENLDFYALADHMFPDSAARLSVEQLCSFFSDDHEVILKRQDILKELLERQDIIDVFTQLADRIAVWEELFSLPDLGDNPEDINAFDAMDSYTAAYAYIQLIHNIQSQFTLKPARSEGIRLLAEQVSEIYNGSSFQKLTTEWDKRMEGLGGTKSMTFAFRLDEYFNMTHIKLIDVSSKKYVGPGKKSDKTREGLTGDDSMYGGFWHNYYKFQSTANVMTFNYDMGDKSNSVDIKRAINNVSALCTGEASKRVREYLKAHTRWIITMKNALLFYLGVVRFYRTLEQKGASLNFPLPGDLNGHQFEAEKLYHPLLPFYGKTREQIIDNDVRMSSEGEFCMLTGANQGGKTTYLRAIGLAQFMMQLGMPVAAERMKADLCDRIFTVFSVGQEELSTHQGKLGQELMRISHIGGEMTASTMVLFNEPMSGTSTAETLIISKEVLCAIKLVGARGVWVTHLHELAADVHRLNEVVGGITLKNLIAVVTHQAEGTTPTYHIIEGEPEMTSYAYDVVRRYGLEI